MTTPLPWPEIALRLALAVIAGTALGLDRGFRGRSAGLRTHLLVCVAAALAMIQVNLLLGLSGRRPDSFVTIDLMRLPLGVLSGMGFLGAGAILRRGSLVTGLTTAASLWYVTILGLCFGGGQVSLGAVATALGLGVLRGLKWVERRGGIGSRVRVVLVSGASGPTEDDLAEALEKDGLRPHRWSVSFLEGGLRREVKCEATWNGFRPGPIVPGALRELAARPDVVRLDWKP